MNNESRRTSLSPMYEIEKTRKASVPAIAQGKKNGYCMKKLIPPKTFGHWVAGLAKSPPMAGLEPNEPRRRTEKVQDLPQRTPTTPHDRKKRKHIDSVSVVC